MTIVLIIGGIVAGLGLFATPWVLNSRKGKKLARAEKRRDAARSLNEKHEGAIEALTEKQVELEARIVRLRNDRKRMGKLLQGAGVDPLLVWRSGVLQEGDDPDPGPGPS